MAPDITTRRIVVIGTGTDVGKTWLAAELLSLLAERGRRAVGLKPVESGVVGERGADAERLGLKSAWTPPPGPYRLADPVSPHLAARREGTIVDLEQILTYVRTNESSQGEAAEVSLVETAGGLFTPLAPGLTNWDLARALEPSSWLLVAPDALGVLHDLTATLAAAEAGGRTPDAIALCRARPMDASTGTNADEIARLGIAARPPVFPDDGQAGLERLLDTLLA
jgi:dethiobiotin synthetase